MGIPSIIKTLKHSSLLYPPCVAVIINILSLLFNFVVTQFVLGIICSLMAMAIPFSAMVSCESIVCNVASLENDCVFSFTLTTIFSCKEFIGIFLKLVCKHWENNSRELGSDALNFSLRWFQPNQVQRMFLKLKLVTPKVYGVKIGIYFEMGVCFGHSRQRERFAQYINNE